MLKIQKDYIEKYGDIPEDYEDRIEYLSTKVNLNKSKHNIYSEINRINSITWNKLSYTMYLLPKATPRPRSGKNGIFYVKGAKDNKKLFEELIKSEDIPLITTPTKFYCRCYFPIPKAMNSVEKVLSELGLIRPTSIPDCDNLEKTYCDMIKGLIIYDDSLIIEGCTKKYYSVKPRIEVDIFYMDTYDCEFNKRKIIGKVR